MRVGRLRGRRPLAAVFVLTLCALAVGAAVALGDDPQPVDSSHNVVDAPAPVAGAAWGPVSSVTPGTAICSTPTSSAANVNTDCESTETTGTVGPHNETSIAINPTNSKNLIGGANDYQLSLSPGGHVAETVLSRAHVTFDGGKTWSEYPLNANSAYQATGDPSVAFDASGHAYYATLGFRFTGLTATNPDVIVNNSGDGGKNWTTVRVAAGSGTFGSSGDLLDKEYVAAWGTGNAIVTFGDFKLGPQGSFISAKIYASVTHDFGQTWTAPQLISGKLDEAFVSTPVVAADGKIYVSFENTTDLSTGRDDYEVVRVDPATGAAIGSPVKVATVIDGATDYPISVDGRQTYQDSQFRTWAAGNIAADPTNAQHLAVVWSDMRNSTLPAPRDPYSAKTNSDVIVSQSFDGGKSWSAAVALALNGDQWMPWGVYDTSGKLRIGTFDRSGDRKNHAYGYTVATESSSGSLTFGTATVTTVQSNPTTGSRWFARNVNKSFPRANAFIGDYSNIAATPTGGVVAYWTDLRNDVTFAGVTGKGEDAYFGRAN
jgi:hypothetical protein